MTQRQAEMAATLDLDTWAMGPCLAVGPPLAYPVKSSCCCRDVFQRIACSFATRQHTLELWLDLFTMISPFACIVCSFSATVLNHASAFGVSGGYHPKVDTIWVTKAKRESLPKTCAF